LAKTAPTSTEELQNLRGAQTHWGKRLAEQMMAAVKRGLALSPEQLPQRKGGSFRSAPSVASDLLRVLLNQRARQNRITPSMLANKEDLLRLAAGQRQGIKVLEGWRHQLVGRELLELLDGDLCLRLSGQSLEVSRQK
jgi:ribonuclease D